MGNLCIIPARGGSKRIPRKNIKNFLGKPIIAYSIETALTSGLFDEVMVSTDDEEISEVARSYGAKVPFLRSRKNSDDFATLNDVLVEVLQEYRILGYSFALGCCILPTAPLLNVENLTKSLSFMSEKGYDSVRPIVRYSYPIQRAFKNNEGSLQFIFEDSQTSRSQDLEDAFHDAGQFYWFNTKTMLTSPNRGGLEIREIEAQDIDSLDDWRLAEMKFSLLKSKI